MTTVTDYESLRWALIDAFHGALKAEREPGVEDEDEGAMDRAQSLHSHAFDLAARYGWSWEDDDGYSRWALKATHQEALAEGLRRAIEHCKPGEGQLS